MKMFKAANSNGKINFVIGHSEEDVLCTLPKHKNQNLKWRLLDNWDFHIEVFFHSRRDSGEWRRKYISNSPFSEKLLILTDRAKKELNNIEKSIIEKSIDEEKIKSKERLEMEEIKEKEYQEELDWEEIVYNRMGKMKISEFISENPSNYWTDSTKQSKIIANMMVSMINDYEPSTVVIDIDLFFKDDLVEVLKCFGFGVESI